MENANQAVFVAGVLSGVCIISALKLFLEMREIKEHYEHDINMKTSEKRLALICGWAKPTDYVWSPVVEEMRPENDSFEALIRYKLRGMLNILDLVYFLKKHAKDHPKENLHARLEEHLGHRLTYLSAFKVLFSPVTR